MIYIAPTDPFPTSFATGETYAFEGGATYTPSASVQVDADNVGFTSYGSGKALIDGALMSDRTLRISGHHFICENLDFKGPPGADTITEFDTDGLILRNCRIESEKASIRLSGADMFTVSFNEIIGGEQGFVRHDSDRTPTGGVVEGNAIDLMRVNANTNGHGIVFTCDGSGTPTDWDYELLVCDNNITNMQTAGIDLAHNCRMIVCGNTIVGDSNYTANPGYQLGMILGDDGVRGPHEHKIFDNHLTGLRHGIMARSGGGCWIFNNTFDDNMTHVIINKKYADGNLFSGNTFTNASKTAFRINGGNCGTGLFGNTYAGNAQDFFIDDDCQVYGTDV